MEPGVFALDSPCFSLVEADASAFENLRLQFLEKSKEHGIRIIRGEKCRTAAAFFNEVSAALQFPYYFGENWNALEECLVDLDWLEVDAYLLMVNQALALLREDEEDFRLFLRILIRVQEAWLTPNRYIPRKRQPTPFHVLFQCTPVDSAAFLQRFTDAQHLIGSFSLGAIRPGRGSIDADIRPIRSRAERWCTRPAE